MSTLVDHEIRELCRKSGLVEPFDVDLCNPASIDIRLGDTILVEGRICGPEQERSRWIKHKISDTGYNLAPGQFILAHSFEVIRIPNWLEATFHLKSSRGREGLNHLLAGYVDPGFNGRITLELQNVNSRHNVELTAGMRIGQLRFSKLEHTPLQSYAVTGRYMNDMTVVASRG